MSLNKIKQKILLKLPTLTKIKELEKKLREEEVTILDWSSDADIEYKGFQYVDSYKMSDKKDQISTLKKKHSDEMLKLIEKHAENIQKVGEELTSEKEVLEQDKNNLLDQVSTLKFKLQELENLLDKNKKELEESLKRESELRKDLIETMKLNNALNSRTIETKTVSSEPIEIKPINNKKNESK